MENKNAITDKKKVLMHMCCAPCSVYPLSVLDEEGFSIEGLFFNPNIHPLEEYGRRLDTVRLFCTIKDIPLLILDDFRQAEWEAHTGDELSRCTMCYAVRLERTAREAADKGFDAFTTSLLVSPYQNHELIRSLAEKYSSIYNISFLYRDFREGFRKGQQKAREMDLYRQKYCGCIKSLYNKHKSV